MIKKIGNMQLDYTYYGGRDLYSDGTIEDTILQIVKNKREEELLYTSNQWPILYHLSDIRENLLEWYPFDKNGNVLEIGSGCGALTGLLSRKAKTVTCIELSEKRSLINAYRNHECNNVKIMLGNFQDIRLREKYDYVTLIGVWEYAGLYITDENPYMKLIQTIQGLLKEDGRIFIGIENKMGVKYWNGAGEDHTGHLYSGLNDYIEERNVRTFSKPEIEEIFRKQGIEKYQFFYPTPDYKLPEQIYTENMLPSPGSERNYGKDYNSPRMYHFYEDAVLDQICYDRMYSYFSNSFLIITGEENVEKEFVRYNRCRKKDLRVKTEIVKNGSSRQCVKEALNEETKVRILEIKENEEKWRGCLPKLKYVEGKVVDGKYITPYIDGMDLDVLFYEYRNNIDLFIEKFCYYIKTYLEPREEDKIPFCISEPFETIFGRVDVSGQFSLKCTNLDLIFSNLKLTKQGDLYCFDYEWIFDFLIPYEYVIRRIAANLYLKYNVYLRKRMSQVDFLRNVGITKENIPVYEEMEKRFMEFVHGKNNKELYLRNYKKTIFTQSITFR